MTGSDIDFIGTITRFDVSSKNSIPEYERYQGQPITKPFKGYTFGENDLTSDDYTDIWSGPDPTRVVILDTFDAFDEFTNKYGKLYERSIKQ